MWKVSDKKQRQKTYLTNDAIEDLQREQERLRLQERPEALEHLKKAREMGDLSENGYYKASRFKLSGIDRRLREIAFLLATAVVIEKPVTRGIVSLGSTVTLVDEAKTYTYTIVGAYEANPSEGKISDVSPIGRILLDKKVNDQVVLQTPRGEKRFTITQVV